MSAGETGEGRDTVKLVMSKGGKGRWCQYLWGFIQCGFKYSLFQPPSQRRKDQRRGVLELCQPCQGQFLQGVTPRPDGQGDTSGVVWEDQDAPAESVQGHVQARFGPQH